MTLNDYQKEALKTAIGKRNELFIARLTLGLSGESGEVAEKIKKWLRDNDGDINLLDKKEVAKELGDVLWYSAVLADAVGFSLDEVAKLSVEKLSSRNKRGVIGGSGDNR